MTVPTGVGKGGAREGAGRPKGSINHRTRTRIIEARHAGELLPLDFLLQLMRDNELPLKDRAFCAVAALPFCHPRLSVQKVSIIDPNTLSDSELLASIDRLERLAEMSEPEPPANPAPGGVVRPAEERHQPVPPLRRPGSPTPESSAPGGGRL